MTPPDPGEREVTLYCQHGCQHRATSCDVCAACAHFVADRRAHAVSVPLAQRILAALVQRREWELASELRAAVERKP